jgi:hypothetical protein
MGLPAQKPNEPTAPCRELYFHERTDSQKIEKMADAIQYLVQKLKEAGESIDQLKRHSHADGQITVPMIQDRHGDRFSESYFFKNPLGVERP